MFSIVHAHKLKRKLSLSNNPVKIGVARATLCHTLATPLLYSVTIYRMAGNFRDLVFADGRSRVAPPTISVRLHLLLHARRGSNFVGTGQKKQQAPDQSIVLVL